MRPATCPHTKAHIGGEVSERVARREKGGDREGKKRTKVGRVNKLLSGRTGQQSASWPVRPRLLPLWRREQDSMQLSLGVTQTLTCACSSRPPLPWAASYQGPFWKQGSHGGFNLHGDV
ncbi:MAG: hypothetical protein ACK56I_26105 [bacterium]